MPARDVEPTVADMERYLADSAADPPRLRRSRDARPPPQANPRRGLWAVLAGAGGDRGRLVAGGNRGGRRAGGGDRRQLPRLLPSTIGGSPEPSVTPTMEPSPTFTITPPRPTEPATESEEPSPSPSDDEDDEDDGDRTPRPSAPPSGTTTTRGRAVAAVTTGG